MEQWKKDSLVYTIHIDICIRYAPEPILVGGVKDERGFEWPSSRASKLTAPFDLSESISKSESRKGFTYVSPACRSLGCIALPKMDLVCLWNSSKSVGVEFVNLG